MKPNYRKIDSSDEWEFLLEQSHTQALLVQNGEVLWHASHWGITYERIEQQVNERIAKT
ncbi:monothiol bacilliredoxin BrxC family protein [Saccharibacillus kuerlensis]|uniref:Uncharacterized protein n=1 Tax=Saccharibacillus kuerlensis TaxID=459527 RepID=A0ABQ2L4W9_9BACL|nr:monothiol bacilliredoxin BrxC family protein [Saccharibacillus kuerlensis]GGO03282.1 hypothetical protein GCM10010969_27410 [Saccharibacillus kuerlensis]